MGAVRRRPRRDRRRSPSTSRASRGARCAMPPGSEGAPLVARRPGPAARRPQRRAGGERPSAGLEEPDARRPLQPGRDRRRHRGAHHLAGRREPRREGGAGRASPDGRRLPERGLRAVEGADPLGAPRARTERARARLRRCHGAHARDPRAHQPRRLGQALPGGVRRRDLLRPRALHGPANARRGRHRARVREGRDRERRARDGAADPRPRARPATSTTRRSSRSPSGRGASR